MTVFRPIRRTHRVPIVLLALLVGTLLFPRAFDEVRIAVGAWLPATARAERAPVAPLDEERVARLSARLNELQQELAARVPAGSALGSIDHAPRRDRPAGVAIPARVLHRDTSPLRRTFLVDVGRDDGVEPGQPVTQCDSLVGIVTAAAGGAARVVRIDDRSATTSLPAAVLRGDGDTATPCRGEGVARGMGDGRIRVSFLPSDGARPGDLVVTGAGSRLVAEGLVLGVVLECDDADRDGSFEAIVRPLRDLDAVAAVCVLRAEPLGLRVDAK